jgi:hypothetical protein
VTGPQSEHLEAWVEEELIEGEPQRPWRRVSTLAVLSVVAGAASSLIFMDWMLGSLCLVGVALGALAIRRIHRHPELLTGLALAWVGIGLSGVTLVSGMSWAIYSHFAMAPPGYIAVTYAELQPDPDNPRQKYPPRAKELHDRKVYIKGFMYPTRQSLNLRRFSMSPFNGDCKYCIQQPKPTEKIRVELVGDLTTDFTVSLVGVGGKFQLEESEGGEVVYRLEADYIR